MTPDNIINLLLVLLAILLIIIFFITAKPSFSNLKRLFFLVSNKIRVLLQERSSLIGRPDTALILYPERVVEVLRKSKSLGLSFFSPESYVDREIEVKYNDAGQVIRVLPEEYLRDHSKIVVLGGPGAGKTTLLRHLEFLSANRDINFQWMPEYPIYIPISQLAYFEDSFEALVAMTVREKYGIYLSQYDWKSRLEEGDMLILLDGLDELGYESEAYHTAIEKIKSVNQIFSSNKIVLTCRTSAWTDNLPEFRETTLPLLNKEGMRRFIVKNIPLAECVNDLRQLF